MTDRATQIHFDFYHKQVVADFKGGAISSDAGLLPLRQLDDRLGWLAQAAQVLADDRDPRRTQHDDLALLRQRTFGLIAGYEDANDHQRMRHDPILKLVADRPVDHPGLASQPTLSRFENRITARQVVRLNRLLIHHVVSVHRQRHSKEIILDLDPTDDPCHGHQQLALFNGFYDQYMYLPLLVFDRATGLLAGVRLQSGTSHPSQRAVAVLKPIVQALRQALPNASIRLRADAGLASPKLYDFCEDHGVGYAIGIGANAVFKERTQWAVSWQCERFERWGEPCRWIGGWRHRAESWRQPRRIVYKAEANAEGTNRRFVVTNLPGSPTGVYEFYSDRGTAVPRSE